MPEKKLLTTVPCAVPSRTEQQPVSTGASSHKISNPALSCSTAAPPPASNQLGRRQALVSVSPYQPLSHQMRNLLATAPPEISEHRQRPIPQIHPSSQWKICVKVRMIKWSTQTAPANNQLQKRATTPIWQARE